MKSIKINQTGSSGELKYTWEQNLDEIILYFSKENLYGTSNIKENIKKDDLKITILCNELIITNQLTKKCIFNEVLFNTIDTSESLWYIENDELIIQLSKMRKGYVWDSINKNNEDKLNPLEIENVKRQMMLERFQREVCILFLFQNIFSNFELNSISENKNPGFDFSNAEFNGNIPDPRNFMGGLKHY